MSKVKLPLIKVWVQNEVARILGSDDDVVIEMIMGMLESNKSVSASRSRNATRDIFLTASQPNIKQLQTDVTGFLDKDAAPFCLSLWKLCLSAQEDPNGIPKELLEAKKEELMQERVRWLPNVSSWETKANKAAACGRKGSRRGHPPAR